MSFNFVNFSAPKDHPLWEHVIKNLDRLNQLNFVVKPTYNDKVFLSCDSLDIFFDNVDNIRDFISTGTVAVESEAEYYKKRREQHKMPTHTNIDSVDEDGQIDENQSREIDRLILESISQNSNISNVHNL